MCEISYNIVEKVYVWNKTLGVCHYRKIISDRMVWWEQHIKLSFFHHFKVDYFFQNQHFLKRSFLFHHNNLLNIRGFFYLLKKTHCTFMFIVMWSIHFVYHSYKQSFCYVPRRIKKKKAHCYWVTSSVCPEAFPMVENLKEQI